MEKNKGLVVSVIVLLVAVLLLGGYIIYDKFFDNKSDNKVITEKGKEETNENNKMPEKSNDYTFVKSNVKEIKVNDKNYKLISYYYYDKEKFNQNDGTSEDIYYVRKEVYLNLKKVYKMHKIDFIDDMYSDENERDYNKVIDDDIKNTTVEYVKDSVSKDQYILFTDCEEEEVSYIDNTIKYKVLIDKNGNELYKFALNSYNTGYYMEDNNIKKDTKNYLDHTFNNSILYIGNDYLYYLDINNCTSIQSITETSESGFEVDEYQIKIKNGKLEKLKTTTYDNFQVETAGAGPSCK